VFAAGIFTMMFLIRRHLVSVELNAYKAKMTGQVPDASSPVASRPHRSLFRLPWKKTAKVPEPQPEEKVEEATPSEQVSEPSETVAEPSETVTEPAEEATEANDQDY
jgi:hypothetical protein